MKSKKIQSLKKILKDMKGIVLAFSGGLDSTFLLKMAIDTVGRDGVLAVTARSDAFPKREYTRAKSLAESLAARFITIYTHETKNSAFIRNPVNRCYYCKKELFGRLNAIAKKEGFRAVIDGTNFDDRKDIRHGRRAAKELGVRSPLDEARIGKGDIRRFSRLLGLSTWDQPPFACLASRFPYYQTITTKKLKDVDMAEQFLYNCGFKQVRVRAHKNIARIEVLGRDIKRILSSTKLQRGIIARLKQHGFSYVTLDLEGYRTGSMNESMRRKRKTIAPA